MSAARRQPLHDHADRPPPVLQPPAEPAYGFSADVAALTREGDVDLAGAPSGMLLSRWKQDLAGWPGPALLVDSRQQVIAVNDLAAQAGVSVDQPFAQALTTLTGFVDVHTRRSGHGPQVRVVAIQADDFDGWFVDAAAALPPEGDAERAISQRLASSNLRLQEEIRRRRFLERQILSVAEQEKRRISLELHDGLGQHLTGVAFVARGISDEVRSGNPVPPGEIDWLVRLINEAVVRTRGLARGLWPVSLERGSLGESIRKLAEDLESIFSVSCTVELLDEPRIPSNTAAHHVFRVVQEAANNAIKHGRARRLQFRLEAVGNDFEVSVVNDGLMVDPESLSNPKGIGVVGMKLRADALGGELSIEPLHSGGAEVTLKLPGMAGQGRSGG